MMGRGDEGRYRYVPLGTPRVRAARERWVRERRGVGGGVATQHCALVRPDEGRDGGAGTGRRAGGTRRGGRRLSEGQGWSAQRQAYEVGLALEWVVRQVEIEEVGGSGEIGEIFYWNNPFLLPSLPSLPLPCECACCQGLPCKKPCASGCRQCWVRGGCSRAFGRRPGECCRVYERPGDVGAPVEPAWRVRDHRLDALRCHFACLEQEIAAEETAAAADLARRRRLSQQARPDRIGWDPGFGPGCDDESSSDGWGSADDY